MKIRQALEQINLVMDFDRTVLVTGGSGFIGSHLVCALVERHPDWRIINFDILDYCCSPRSLESIENRANYTFIKGDLCNAQQMKHIFNTENIDVVFHLAAQTHVDTSFQCPSSFHRVNIVGTRVLLAAAHAARHTLQRFIHASTDEVYGSSQNEVFDESSPMSPSNPYSASKAAADYLVRSYWDKYKFPVIITRSNNIYGPRQYFEKVIPRFVTLLVNDKKCTIAGTVPKSRHFMYVDDVVNAFLLLMEKGVKGEVYNVGGSSEIGILQLAKELIRMVRNVPDVEVNDWFEYVPDRPSVDIRYPISCEKLQRLGWRENVSWSDGIRKTVKWYQDNQDFWSDAAEDKAYK
ncbi:dTDP-D-glucose 4,6-dehydratase-like isoform X2 [Nerophis ophidion]|uniref:dTDP-D-glucose 4,6-dehydratase-like isoform X2 n=1 Tax=Nerophis ophidion TaxID=159077 RepID=UPI002ADFD8AF|nr:dTDP-D-glucose 4,6-dehydratase-like isoform X2 [Nerophis ophidion]